MPNRESSERAESSAVSSTASNRFTADNTTTIIWPSNMQALYAFSSWPSTLMPVILTAVYGWRCPFSFLYCFLRL